MSKVKRQPYPDYAIRQMIRRRQFAEAQEACDENVEFFRDRIGDMQSMFLTAQCGLMKVKPTTENKLAAASADKRVTVNQTEGVNRA